VESGAHEAALGGIQDARVAVERSVAFRRKGERSVIHGIWE
jgi:hypothetical protein